MLLHRIASPEHYVALSAYPGLAMAEVVAHPEKPWRWGVLSKHPNLTIAIVLQFSDKQWDWWSLSENPAITMADVEQHLNLRWDWRHLSKNPNVTMAFVERHINENWRWDWLSANPGITMDDMMQHWGYPSRWEIYTISENPNFTPEIVDWYFNRRKRRDSHFRVIGICINNFGAWNWQQILSRPDITLDFVLRNEENIPGEYFLPFVMGKMDSFLPPEEFLKQSQSIGVALDGSPWIPGTEYTAWCDGGECAQPLDHHGRCGAAPGGELALGNSPYF